MKLPTLEFRYFSFLKFGYFFSKNMYYFVHKLIVCVIKKKGLEALKEHFKNSKFPCEMDHYLPVVFSPPRDGRLQTEPLPIVGHNKQPIPTKAVDKIDGQDGLEEDDGSDDFDADQRDVMMGTSNSSISRSSSSSSNPNGGVNGDDDDDQDRDDSSTNTK